MPEALRLDEPWYEEDCEWARAYCAFPECFKPEEVAAFLESGGFRSPGIPESAAGLHRSPEIEPRGATSAQEGEPALRSSE